jgi:hypothetical protein
MVMRPWPWSMNGVADEAAFVVHVGLGQGDDARGRRADRRAFGCCDVVAEMRRRGHAVEDALVAPAARDAPAFDGNDEAVEEAGDLGEAVPAFALQRRFAADAFEHFGIGRRHRLRRQAVDALDVERARGDGIGLADAAFAGAGFDHALFAMLAGEADHGPALRVGLARSDAVDEQLRARQRAAERDAALGEGAGAGERKFARARAQSRARSRPAFPPPTFRLRRRFGRGAGGERQRGEQRPHAGVSPCTSFHRCSASLGPR